MAKVTVYKNSKLATVFSFLGYLVILIGFYCAFNDEIAIGVVNTKTTAVRIIPAYGKSVGEQVEFGGLLGTAPIMPVRNVSPAAFIARGGRIPAPMQSLKN